MSILHRVFLSTVVVLFGAGLLVAATDTRETDQRKERSSRSSKQKKDDSSDWTGQNSSRAQYGVTESLESEEKKQSSRAPRRNYYPQTRPYGGAYPYYQQYYPTSSNAFFNRNPVSYSQRGLYGPGYYQNGGNTGPSFYYPRGMPFPIELPAGYKVK